MEFDISGKIGPMWPESMPTEWPMYSYERPGWIVWNAIAGRLHEAGWSEGRIKDWLQSKSPRWALDDQLGNALAKVAREYADTLVA